MAEDVERTVEARARNLYEASRRNVSGRPPWDALDPRDPYDMGMRDTALAKAREGMSSSLRDKAAALSAHLGGNARKITVGVGAEVLHVYVRGRRYPLRDRLAEWQGVGVEWHVGVGTPRATQA